MTRISVFGLGYVGCVSAACLARDGHVVIGLDVNGGKIAALNAGHSPVQEPGVASLIATAVEAGHLRGTCNVVDAINDSEVSLVCVGTPSDADGSPDLQFVRRVCEQIGRALRDLDRWHTVVLRSTMLPGSTEHIALRILRDSSGREPGREFGVAYNPEFLREGTAIADFDHPARIIIGEFDRVSGNAAASLYDGRPTPIVRTSIRTAEMLKYADNAFHAMKVAFANEIGNVCAAHDIDGVELMRLFAEDRHLNLSPAYLKPGFAFGGSCLPKDLRALIHRSRELGVNGPLLPAILESNEQQKRRAFAMIQRTGCRRVGVLGLSFKHETDDVRESPALQLVERLLDHGYDVAIYDRYVSPAALMGANRSYIERELPRLPALMSRDLDAVLDQSEVLVITTADPEFGDALSRLRPDQAVIDLVPVPRDLARVSVAYQGICW